MIVPKFIYDAGAGPVTLTPTYPATQKITGAHALSAERHDSIVSDGSLKQSVTERVDSLLPLSFPFVPLADLPDWEAFLSFALGGGEFDYYPDSTSGTHTTYTLENTDWTPKYTAKGHFSMELSLRKV